MKNFFIDLYQYNQLVNEKLLAQVIAHADTVSKRTLDLCTHMQLVHLSWNNRMLSKEGLADFWQPTEIQELPALNNRNNDTSIGIINSVDLDDYFTYRNSKGTEFKNKFSDALFHLINHSTYHRGQINALLRTAGVEPVLTEYILFKR
jgi:uncharacterized damage-inducible protein DinB